MRYFFDVDDQGRRVVDTIGIDHASPSCAVLEVTPILEWIAACRDHGTGTGNISVSVRSSAGRVIAEVIAHFSEH